MPHQSKDVLVLYDDHSLQTAYVTQHLDALQMFSRHRVHYAAATFNRRADFPLQLYDAIIIHFSIRLTSKSNVSEDFILKLPGFSGLKVLMIQDEYDTPEIACAWIRRLGINTIYSTVPPEHRDAFYPPGRLPDIEFRSCLTGYVPFCLPPDEQIPPISERPTCIAYRGRRLPVWYGALGRQKYEIAEKVRDYCIQRGISHNIESAEDKRIYGDAWFNFLGSAKLVLGTESGANVVDKAGSIRRSVEQAREANPEIGDEELYARFVKAFDGHVRMNQISPKIFEAIATKTGLLLLDGDYSGVLEPWTHFLPLKHDYSNLDDLMEFAQDDEYLQAMVDRTYHDVIEAGNYSYARFVADIDSVLDRAKTTKDRRRWHFVAMSCADSSGENIWSAAGADVPHLLPVDHGAHPVTTSRQLTDLKSMLEQTQLLAREQLAKQEALMFLSRQIDRITFALPELAKQESVMFLSSQVDGITFALPELANQVNGVKAALSEGFARRIWAACPETLKRILRPAAERFKAALHKI